MKESVLFSRITRKHKTVILNIVLNIFFINILLTWYAYTPIWIHTTHVYYTLYIIQFTLYSVQFTLYSVQCTLYTWFTLYIVHLWGTYFGDLLWGSTPMIYSGPILGTYYGYLLWGPTLWALQWGYIMGLKKGTRSFVIK